MQKIMLKLLGSRWRKLEKEGAALHLKGEIYLGEKIASLTELLDILKGGAEGGDSSSPLSMLNGFHSGAYIQNEYLLAFVDHVRSFPLFYAERPGVFYLSDDAEWIREQLDDLEYDPIAHEEFLLAGYVTGRDTLYRNIKQLQAGECITVNWRNGVSHTKIDRYYKFWHREPAHYDADELADQLYCVTRKAMERLIRYADGRQIAVPLSGGHDSRLIVSMLRKLKYENVLCFTYGIPENGEAVRSKKVAESLGFDWKFIEYSSSLWRREWRRPEARAYRSLAANHSSLPHVQDWLAIKQLMSAGVLSPGSVVAPGHSGDFVAGSHIPRIVFSRKQHSKASLLRSLIKDHLSNSPKKNMSIAQDALLEGRIESRISAQFDGTDIGFANLYEMWDWQERQAKYIINSVRVYDQFELDWWLPQWDLEFVRFWETVPLTLRRGRAWFKKWIDDQYLNLVEDPSSIAILHAMEKSSFSRRLLYCIAEGMPEILLAPVRRARRARGLRTHFLAFEGLIDVEELPRYLNKNYTLVGMYSDSYLRGKW